jgi:putative flippase GtrA
VTLRVRPSDRLRSLSRVLAGDARFRYLIIGGVNTVFSFAVFTLLIVVAEPLLHYLGVLVTAHVITTFTGYLTQRTFVFRAKGRFWRDLPRFWSVYLCALGLNAVGLTLLIEVAGIPVLVAQAVITVALAVATFFAHKHFSFRRRGEAQVGRQEERC